MSPIDHPLADWPRTEGRASNVACHAASRWMAIAPRQIGEAEIQIRQRDPDPDMADGERDPSAHRLILQRIDAGA